MPVLPGVSSRSPQQSLPYHGLCLVTTTELVCMHFEIKDSNPQLVQCQREASVLWVELGSGKLGSDLRPCEHSAIGLPHVGAHGWDTEEDGSSASY